MLGIDIIALKQISFIGESWSLSFINLIVSSMYFFIVEPMGKRKWFLRQETILSYILFIVSNEIEVLEYDHGNIVAWCSVIPSSLFVHSDVSFWLFLDTFFLHFVWCFFKSDEVLYVLLQKAHYLILPVSLLHQYHSLAFAVMTVY